MTASEQDKANFSSLHGLSEGYPPEMLFLPTDEKEFVLRLPSGGPDRQDQRIWEGYLDASCILLDTILNERPLSQSLIFPALFNLRHAMEVALKWHIRYAGGTIPRGTGHNLENLIQIFRKTAENLDEDSTHIDDGMLDFISEIASIDERAITFRYGADLNGNSTSISGGPWDIKNLIAGVEYLTLWFDHLSLYIDMSTEEYQAMVRERAHR